MPMNHKILIDDCKRSIRGLDIPAVGLKSVIASAVVPPLPLDIITRICTFTQNQNVKCRCHINEFDTACFACDFRHIESISRVSKHLRAATEPLLYRRIVLSTSVDGKEEDQESCADTAIIALNRTLRARPDLAATVETITFYTTTPSADNILLQLCTNLDHLETCDIQHALWSTSTTLRTLTIPELDFHRGTLFAELFAFHPQLCNLHMGINRMNVDSILEFETIAALSGAHLEYLDIQVAPMVKDTFVRFLWALAIASKEVRVTMRPLLNGDLRVSSVVPPFALPPSAQAICVTLTIANIHAVWPDGRFPVLDLRTFSTVEGLIFDFRDEALPSTLLTDTFRYFPPQIDLLIIIGRGPTYDVSEDTDFESMQVLVESIRIAAQTGPVGRRVIRIAGYLPENWWLARFIERCEKVAMEWKTAGVSVASKSPSPVSPICRVAGRSVRVFNVAVLGVRHLKMRDLPTPIGSKGYECHCLYSQ